MKTRPIYFIAALLLIASFFLIYFIFRNFGMKYDQGLASIIPKSQDPVAPRKARTVRKVTVLQEDSGCMEVTPDGIVRTYDRCGGELVDANRLSDPKNVLRLIQVASQIDFSNYRQKLDGPYITLIIETDSGTETVYIPIGGGNGNGGSGGDDIIQIIDQIKGDLPQPTATPIFSPDTPTPTLGGVSNTPTPTPLISPTFGPSPTPTPTGNPDNPFTCGFTQSSNGPRPYNVSNYICSTQPSPAP